MEYMISLFFPTSYTSMYNCTYVYMFRSMMFSFKYIDLAWLCIDFTFLLFRSTYKFVYIFVWYVYSWVCVWFCCKRCANLFFRWFTSKTETTWDLPKPTWPETVSFYPIRFCSRSVFHRHQQRRFGPHFTPKGRLTNPCTPLVISASLNCPYSM